MEDEQVCHFLRNESKGSRVNAIQGMESVIATVSGYHGLERFNLIKLISNSGANFVGAMSRSTTHLVCWKFDGRKYNLAKKFKTLIVNHRWVEDCIKAGKRLSERPYILQSGEEVGPLSLEVPVVTKKPTPLTKKNHKVLSDQTNALNDSKEPAIGFKCGGTSHAFLADSCLLNEDLFPKSSNQSKKKTVKKTLKDCLSSIQEPSLFELVGLEHGESSPRHSTRSVRQKRICGTSRATTSAEPSHKGRRLVKKNIMESISSDSDHESDQARTNIVAPSDFPDFGNISINTSNLEGNVNNDSDDIEEIGVLNLPSEDVPAVTKNTLQGCADVDEKLDAEMKENDDIEEMTRLADTKELLSCVICWTDFSSTRGVLPCGHRFCYSCIQNWSDHMASRRKVSTCPLCKASFASITKVDDAATSDQKIYSQTIPCPSSTTDIFFLPDQDTYTFGAQTSLAQVCRECHQREPEDLLVKCRVCETRCIHSYCLDPPLFPWTCIDCKDLQMLYHRFR